MRNDFATFDDNPPSKLTLTSYGNETSFTWPGSDQDTREILDAFVGLMVAHTFHINSIENAMVEYLEDHNYIVTRDLRAKDKSETSEIHNEILIPRHRWSTQS